MIKKICVPLILFFAILSCDHEDTTGFIGRSVYLCNSIQGDSIDYYKKYVYAKYMKLFNSHLINKIEVQNPETVDSMIIQQHNNYTSCDTFNIPQLNNKSQFVVVLKLNIKVRYKTDDPSNAIPIYLPTGMGSSVDIVINKEKEEDVIPEYHYYTSITGTIYDITNKKRVYVFTKSEDSQDDQDTCSHCIIENIDNIFENFEDDVKDNDKWDEYQKLNNLKLRK